MASTKKKEKKSHPVCCELPRRAFSALPDFRADTIALCERDPDAAATATATEICRSYIVIVAALSASVKTKTKKKKKIEREITHFFG